MKYVSKISVALYKIWLAKLKCFGVIHIVKLRKEARILRLYEKKKNVLLNCESVKHYL